MTTGAFFLFFWSSFVIRILQSSEWKSDVYITLPPPISTLSPIITEQYEIIADCDMPTLLPSNPQLRA